MSFDWRILRNNQAAEVRRLNGIYENLLNSAGVDIHPQRAELTAPKHLHLVDGAEHTAERVLLATGGAPQVPDFPGSERALISDDLFELDELPERLLIIGGGYIAVEFASIFAALGSEVVLSYRGGTLLRHFDADISRCVLAELRRSGVSVRLNCDIERLDPEGHLHRVSFAGGDAETFEQVLCATGRAPRLGAIAAGAGELALTETGKVAVDADFATSIPHLYALGDIIEGPELTPVAIAEAMNFAERAYGGSTEELDYANIPTAVFTQPSVGTAGPTEAEAREMLGEDIDIYRTEFRHLKHTLSGSEERTMMKLIVRRSTDVVLAVHVVGLDAGEIVQGFAAAVRAGVTKSQLDGTIGIHPTAAEELVTLREPLQGATAT